LGRRYVDDTAIVTVESNCEINILRYRGYHALLTPFGKVFHVEKRWKLIREMGSGAYGVVMSVHPPSPSLASVKHSHSL
jgi:hypothetical protein